MGTFGATEVRERTSPRPHNDHNKGRKEGREEGRKRRTVWGEGRDEILFDPWTRLLLDGLLKAGLDGIADSEPVLSDNRSVVELRVWSRLPRPVRATRHALLCFALLSLRLPFRPVPGRDDLHDAAPRSTSTKRRQKRVSRKEARGKGRGSRVVGVGRREKMTTAKSKLFFFFFFGVKRRSRQRSERIKTKE